jgi:hypothetical protein
VTGTDLYCTVEGTSDGFNTIDISSELTTVCLSPVTACNVVHCRPAGRHLTAPQQGIMTCFKVRI